MVLHCPNNSAELHRLGKEAVSSLQLAGRAKSSYGVAKTAADEPVIPEPHIFEDNEPVGRGNFAARPTWPRASELAVHLELLEVLHVLREQILRSAPIDNAVGIALERETKTGKNGDTKTLRDTTFEKRRKVKWEKFIEFAVVRFMAWLSSVQTSQQALDGDHLPPLDVIMVWHSFLLNPRLFRQHYRNHPIYRLRMPWQAIHVCVKSRDWSFTLSAPASDNFKKRTGLSGDLYVLFSTWSKLGGKKTMPKSLLLSEFTLSKTPGESDVAALSDGNQIRRHRDAYNASYTNQDLHAALRDAVVRQTSFVDKMNALLWVRSPALGGTLRRAIERYDQFLELLKRYPPVETPTANNAPVSADSNWLTDPDENIWQKKKKQRNGPIVPTLDIDLAWHTHQCSGGRAYAVDMVARVGRFINHDDTIVQDVIDDGGAETARRYRLHFGAEYKRCHCWDCEMLLSELETAAASLQGTMVDMKAIAERVESEVGFHRAVEVARRTKKPLPVRND